LAKKTTEKSFITYPRDKCRVKGFYARGANNAFLLRDFLANLSITQSTKGLIATTVIQAQTWHGVNMKNIIDENRTIQWQNNGGRKRLGLSHILAFK